MSDYFSEEDVVITVTRLTRSQLVRFIDGALVKPQRDRAGYIFRPVDIARLELLCDLSQDLDLDDTALGIVISLIDQLHAARHELAEVAGVIETLPRDLRHRIDTAMKRG
jgi:chaperone modulatory protein CbpM